MSRLLPLAFMFGATGCELLTGPSRQSDLPSATAVQIIASMQHSCALTSEGGVRCWGTNSLGQLGAGTDEELDPHGERNRRFLAVQVVGLETGVAAISANGGDTTCALTTGGGVKCWGDGASGALGNGDSEPAFVPVDVIGLDHGVTAISVGSGHACAVTDAGAVKCWGENSDGQLGDGTLDSTDEPIDVVGLPPGVVDITAGGRHTCALTSSGGVSCWGDNTWGQVGSEGADWTVTSPTPVTGLTSAVAKVAAGALHTCVLTAAGSAKCWGGNAEGQLGNGDDTHAQSDTPVDVVGLSAGVDDIHPAGWYSMARVGDAAMLWGAFDMIDVEDTPIDSVATSGVAQLAAGNLHACYINTEGGVMCWGDNNTGAVGFWDVDDTLHQEPEPIPVDSLP